MKRGGPLARRTPLAARSGLARGGALPARSAKTEKVYEARRPLVAEILDSRRWCEAQIPGVCLGQATQVHEVLTRGRGGSILDPDNLLALCGAGPAGCHPHITGHPKWADLWGFTLPGWEGAEYVAARERRRAWARQGRPLDSPS